MDDHRGDLPQRRETEQACRPGGQAAGPGPAPRPPVRRQVGQIAGLLGDLAIPWDGGVGVGAVIERRQGAPG